MKSLKEFLLKEYVDIYKSHENESILVLHKLADMLDDGHVDKKDGRYDINVGKLIRDKKYYNLNLTIIKSSGNEISLMKNKNKEKEYTLLIKTSEFPERTKIDSFLKEESKVKGFKREFSKFISHHLHDEEAESKTSYEKTKEINNKESFEKIYSDLLKIAENKYQEYKDAVDECDKLHKNDSNELGKQELVAMAKETLKISILGDSEDDFFKKVLKEYTKNNIKLLNKEFKNKLEKRLKNFYETKII